jgi:hypothetical protein
MNIFKHYRLVTAAICVAGFLAQGNAVAGPNTWGATYCTTGTTCLQFIVNNNTSEDLYIAIETKGSNCYGPKSDSASQVGANMQSVEYDLPDTDKCSDLENSSTYLNLYANVDAEDPLCQYSLTTALNNVTDTHSYFATYAVSGDGSTECAITQVIGKIE